MRVEVIYYEYDCGHPCTPDGCPGHDGPAVGLSIDGHDFINENYARGDNIPNIEEMSKAGEAAVTKLREE